jgi:hypothetical protein
MNQITYMFENPVLTLVNVVMLLGILLAVAAIPWLNKITEEQRKRNDAMQKENMRLQGHLQQ